MIPTTLRLSFTVIVQVIGSAPSRPSGQAPGQGLAPFPNRAAVMNAPACAAARPGAPPSQLGSLRAGSGWLGQIFGPRCLLSVISSAPRRAAVVPRLGRRPAGRRSEAPAGLPPVGSESCVGSSGAVRRVGPVPLRNRLQVPGINLTLTRVP